MARDIPTDECRPPYARSLEELCPIAERIINIEKDLVELNSIVLGPPPDRDNGLRKRIRTVEEAVKQLTWIKWGIIALVAFQSPRLFELIKPLLK